ncbi:MAG: homoserine dehydrogenase [Planctomycetota bacterium]|jgi:predicted homoserine dehydrogenase-like protein
MHPLKDRLEARETPIKASVIGIGSIGKGLAFQLHKTPGFQLVALADIVLDRAKACADWLSMPYAICRTPEEVEAATSTGKLAVCRDALVLASARGEDVLIEASNAVHPGARHALAALDAGKHVVMMNFEAELMYGPYLLQQARSRGLVYTCSDGDQPTVIKRLVDDVSFWGFDLVMLGNIKGYHDLYTDPTKIAPEADKRNLDHKMCSSYTDGSKLGVEMASLANALGGRVHRPGMLGPRMSSIHDVFEHIDFASIWNVGDPPIVDYVVGAKPTGGVFVIGHTADPFQQFTLSWFPPDMGPGPFYLFYRPYHLGHIEALNCVAEAVLDNSSRLAPDAGMRTNVFCYAKKDLQAGDTLDGMGGYATYGLIENLGDAGLPPGVPQLICDGVRLKRPVAKDGRIALVDCEFDMASPEYVLYQQACSR